MRFQAILFDVNGTLIDIETDEGRDSIYQTISRFLGYQGTTLPPELIRERYFEIMAAQRSGSAERHPEFDVVGIWKTLLADAGQLAPEKITQLPLLLAELHRTLAMNRLAPYPDVAEVLAKLRQSYSLGVVSDAQIPYAVPELRAVGLDRFFRSIIVSGERGYRKPDSRLFAAALQELGVRPDQAIYVGNDMYCDVYGAQRAGMQAVFWPTQYGRKEYAAVKADYIIYEFAQLPQAVAFLEGR